MLLTAVSTGSTIGQFMANFMTSNLTSTSSSPVSQAQQQAIQMLLRAQSVLASRNGSGIDGGDKGRRGLLKASVVLRFRVQLYRWSSGVTRWVRRMLTRGQQQQRIMVHMS